MSLHHWKPNENHQRTPLFRLFLWAVAFDTSTAYALRTIQLSDHSVIFSLLYIVVLIYSWHLHESSKQFLEALNLLHKTSGRPPSSSNLHKHPINNIKQPLAVSWGWSMWCDIEVGWGALDGGEARTEYAVVDKLSCLCNALHLLHPLLSSPTSTQPCTQHLHKTVPKCYCWVVYAGLQSLIYMYITVSSSWSTQVTAHAPLPSAVLRHMHCVGV